MSSLAIPLGALNRGYLETSQEGSNSNRELNPLPQGYIKIPRPKSHILANFLLFPLPLSPLLLNTPQTLRNTIVQLLSDKNLHPRKGEREVRKRQRKRRIATALRKVERNGRFKYLLLRLGKKTGTKLVSQSVMDFIYKEDKECDSRQEYTKGLATYGRSYGQN